MPRRSPRPAAPGDLELTPEAFGEMVQLSLDRLAPWLTTLPEQPLHRLDRAHRLVRDLREPLPERGVSYRRVLGQIFERVLPTSLNTASPGYLAYIPGGGLLHAAVADLLAAATNRFACARIRSRLLSGPGCPVDRDA